MRIADRIHFPLAPRSIFTAIPRAATSSKNFLGGSETSWIGERGLTTTFIIVPSR